MPNELTLPYHKLHPRIKPSVKSLLKARYSRAMDSKFLESLDSSPKSFRNEPLPMVRPSLYGYKEGSKRVREETRRVYSTIMKNNGFADARKEVKFEPKKHTAFVDGSGNLHIHSRTLRERLLFKLQGSLIKGIIPGRYRLRQ